jgi:hypothetical protein
MRVQQIRFAVFDDSVSIFEIGFALTNGLDFCASKGDAGFKFVEQKVIMPRGAIHGRVPLTGCDWFTRFRFLRRWISRLTLLPGHTLLRIFMLARELGAQGRVPWMVYSGHISEEKSCSVALWTCRFPPAVFAFV